MNIFNIFKRKQPIVCPDWDIENIHKCSKCGHKFIMLKGFIGRILCEDCDPFLSGCTPEARRILKDKKYKPTKDKESRKKANL